MEAQSDVDSAPSSPEKGQRSEKSVLNSPQEEEEEAPVNNPDDNICDVCGGDASWEDDPILLCDGCDVGVHASCYGLKVSILFFPIFCLKMTISEMKKN
jgi:hypothetical protein